jgi:hypothetical protein
MNGSYTKQRCPKCGGNLFLFNDLDGWYEQCLQCSLIRYLDVVYGERARTDSSKAPEVRQSTPVNA